MAKEKRSAVSLNPDGFQEGGGLLSNVDVTWKTVEFVMWDYDGNSPNEVPVTRITMEMDGQDEEHVENYSMGKVEIDEEENRIVSGSITKSCKLGMLVNSLVENGFPKDRIGDDPTVFEELKCHMVRQEIDRPGLERRERADGRKFKESVLLVDRILSLPGEEEREETEAEGRATEVVAEIVKANPKGIDKKKLFSLAFAKLKGDKDRNEILPFIKDSDFLEAGEAAGSWSYDAKKEIIKKK